jgi:para-nitrobenzyl esterase
MLTLLLLLYTAPPAFCDDSVVTTPLGKVRGLLNPLSREFRGVPYAAPPVGAGRWAPPGAVAPWSPATLSATADGTGCVQACSEPAAACPPRVGEDCL